MDEPLPAHVGLGSVFDGRDAGEYVAVRDDDSFGVASGAGSEENLERSLRGKAGHWTRFFRRQSAEPVFKSELSNIRGQLPQQHRIAHGELRLHIFGDTRCEVDGANGIEGNGQYSA